MRQKKLVKRITFIITCCCVMGLAVITYRINKLTKSLEVDIAISSQELEKHKLHIEELQEEMKHMDSKEYIEYIAREQLGMVDADTIIIREKQKP